MEYTVNWSETRSAAGFGVNYVSVTTCYIAEIIVTPTDGVLNIFIGETVAAADDGDIIALRFFEILEKRKKSSSSACGDYANGFLNLSCTCFAAGIRIFNDPTMNTLRDITLVSASFEKTHSNGTNPSQNFV